MPIEPGLYAAYLGAVVLLALMPGTDNVYILTRTLAQGRRAGFLAAAGIALALTAHVSAVTLGLAQLFVSAPALYQAVKWAGIGYLVWLAWRAFRSAPEAAWTDGGGAAARPRGRIVGQAFMQCLLNPKLAVFFVAFLPQFADPAQGAMTAQLLTLGASFAVVSLALFAGLILCVAPMGDWLSRHPAFPKWQARLTGTALGGMAAWLAAEEF